MTELKSLRCPITKQLFRDPVIAGDGYTYERDAIVERLQQTSISLVTGNPIQSKDLLENRVVLSVIEELSTKKYFSMNQGQFKLDVDIRRKTDRPLFRAFGKVIYEAEWIPPKNDSPIVLIKIDGAKAMREASFYMQLSSHANIVRTFGFVESQPNSVMFVQEFADHGDLSELLRERRFCPTEEVLVEIFIQLTNAMIHLAENGIVHGDLACRNALVFQMDAKVAKRNVAKLTDFGLTRHSNLFSIASGVVVSILTVVPVRYTAPEILAQNEVKNYSEKSDIYSMGVLM